MKVVGWLVLVALVIVLIYLALKPKKKQSSCGKAISGSSIAGTKVGDASAETICDVASAVLDYSVGKDSPADKINHALTGVSIDTFKTFGDVDDFANIKKNMHSAYIAGNNAAAIAVQQQAPGMINCQPKGGNGGHIDCDDNPTNLGGGKMRYRTSDGKTHDIDYGKKVPLGGCVVWPRLSDGYSNADAVKSNIAAGDCPLLASLTNTIGGSKAA